MKRQPSEWEKIIANETTDKQLISKIYKQLLQLNSRKINNAIKKMGQRANQTVLQRRHTDGQQTHETMLNITHYQRNANQNTVRCHLMPIRMGAIKKSTNNKCWREYGEKGMSTHSSIFAWRIAWTEEEAWQATIHGVIKSGNAN